MSPPQFDNTVKDALNLAKSATSDADELRLETLFSALIHTKEILEDYPSLAEKIDEPIGSFDEERKAE